jgi:hypothetical protein
MAEDGIPDVLAEQRLGHEVPGMRRLYTHVSDRMREALVQALQVRWEDSLRARAATRPHSPVPLLDELLAPHRRHQADTPSASGTVRHLAAVRCRWGAGAKSISQIPPKQPEGPVPARRRTTFPW